MLRRPDFFSHLGEVSLSSPVPSTWLSLGGEIKIYPAIKEADISAGDACLSSRRGGEGVAVGGSLVPQLALNSCDFSSVFFSLGCLAGAKRIASRRGVKTGIEREIKPKKKQREGTSQRLRW